MPDLSNLIRILGNMQYEFVFVACAIAVEFGVRSKLAKRFLTKSFFVDLVYVGFYRFGVYGLLIGTPLYPLLEERIGTGLLAGTPIWVRIALFLPIQDFGYYAVHRLMHSVPLFWAFHQVHHSQEDMGILTTYRNHPFEMWLKQFIVPTILLVMLGLPLEAWLPLLIFYDVVINLSHLEVTWTYGPLGKVVVSPVFHSIHHSVDERHRNANYAAVLPIWDRAFGTLYHSDERAEAVGLPGWRVRESFLAHMWAPFGGLVEHYRGRAIKQLAPFDEVMPQKPPRESIATED